MKKSFRGRSAELNMLQKKYDSPGFQMVILYGRRRVGKTELMNEFMRKQPCKCISFTSIEQNEKELLSMMTETVVNELEPDMSDTFSFADFEKLFTFIGRYATRERIIFFIDEYPYLAKQCPHIQSLLQKVIDTCWKNSNLFFVICGSLVTFMKDEVLAESAPLHGRCNLELKLKPFNYLETAAFLENYSMEEQAIIYGLTNGVAKYIEQFDVRKTLEENIIEEFFDAGGYFSEEQIKTVISNDRQNPVLYNSIVSAIATGHTKNSEIASCVGMDDISYPLKILIHAEIIEKRYAPKPYYVLDDSMLTFWFRYVSRATSLINAGNGRSYFMGKVVDKLHDFMGNVFEKMCKEYLFLHAGNGKIPLITDIQNYRKTIVDHNGKRKSIEIDLLGMDGKDILLIGECKFRHEKVDKSVFEAFLEKAYSLNTRKALICMFSLSGYTEYVMEHSSSVLLITIEDMYRL